tara:strand:+ start:93 stop:281 length:189 start_codon:yes stop_codon:yes gene_type:complete
MTIIEKGIKATGKCKCCGDYKMKAVWYRWYSPFDRRLIHDMICIKCAKREFGNKKSKEFKEL